MNQSVKKNIKRHMVDHDLFLQGLMNKSQRGVRERPTLQHMVDHDLFLQGLMNKSQRRVRERLT